jgi:hypothetical protein
MSFVDDDGFSNFSLRGKKYFERKRTLAAANTRTNELNALINAPDVIQIAPLPINIKAVPVNPTSLLDIGEVNPNVNTASSTNVALPAPTPIPSPIITPMSNEAIPSESTITVPTLGTVTSKNNKLFLPSIIGAALLIGVVVFLKKKK